MEAIFDVLIRLFLDLVCYGDFYEIFLDSEISLIFLLIRSLVRIEGKLYIE